MSYLAVHRRMKRHEPQPGDHGVRNHEDKHGVDVDGVYYHGNVRSKKQILALVSKRFASYDKDRTHKDMNKLAKNHSA